MRCSVTRPSLRCATRCLMALSRSGGSSESGGRGGCRPDPGSLICPAYASPPSVLRRGGRLVEAHAETQPHRVQDFLDLVQALAPAVLRLEHLGFALLHQLANRADVRVLETVVRADRQLELLDALVEILVGGAGARLIRGGLRLLLGAFLEVDEDVQVI